MTSLEEYLEHWKKNHKAIKDLGWDSEESSPFLLESYRLWCKMTDAECNEAENFILEAIKE